VKGDETWLFGIVWWRDKTLLCYHMYLTVAIWKSLTKEIQMIILKEKTKLFLVKFLTETKFLMSWET